MDRDGTEDVVVICDANGEELARSRHFWMPEGNDVTPTTLAGMRSMLAAPTLLAACRMVIDGWERGDMAGAVGSCRTAVALALREED